MQEGLHSGHRERLINKFVEYPDSFSEHELLELFLFPILPRKDTNETAHRLLMAFGSITKVFSATAEQLMTVRGVGKTIAAQIVLHAKIMQKLILADKNRENKPFTSFDTIKDEVLNMFNGVHGEKLFFILLSEKLEKIFCIDFVGNNDNEVFADTLEITKALSIHKKAKFAILAHNHPSGTAEPSAADDSATKRLCILCEVYGVNLADHIIVAGNKTFSYRGERRLDYIHEIIKAEKIL